jgi:porcupine-like protein
MQWSWMLHKCFQPTVQQAFAVGLSVVAPSLLLRLLVLYSGLQKRIISVVATVLGLLVLWWYYERSVAYFIVLCGIVYPLFALVPRGRGALIAIVCVVFIFFCELFIASKEEWHKVRGSFLVVVMKIISLAFDLEGYPDIKGEQKPASVSSVPDLFSYSSYCLFPGTTVFGPFLTYTDHSKFLHATPLSIRWALSSMVVAAVCLGLSVCILPFLLNEPQYNKWLAAYTAAASFRYSHYFISFLSQSSTIASGIGYDSNQDSWSFSVVHPVAVEIPCSMSMVATNWNLPMHKFLKNYVYKPSRRYLGQFGAVLLTFSTSALLHGMNFQLSAVLLSLGIYAFIESVLRMKLSKRLDACVLDRPCSQSGCGHRHKSQEWWVVLVNTGFVLLNLFHLAYLGVMFDVTNEEPGLQEQVRITMSDRAATYELYYACM